MSILVNYVNDVLAPTPDQHRFIKRMKRSIIKALKNNSPITPKEVYIGGSFSRGSMLRQFIDADIIFVYNNSKDAEKNWRNLATVIYNVLEDNFPDRKIIEAEKVSVNLVTEYEGTQVNFDIVPCYYVNSPKVMTAHLNSQFYQGITTIFHTRYISRYKNYPYFTYVVRLLKDWKYSHNIKLKSFLLELIVIDVYENFYDDIDEITDIVDVLDNCFDDILQTLNGVPVIPSNWRYCNPDNYDVKYETPHVFCPGNPVDNLLNYLTKKEINNIKRKVFITRNNLQEGNYSDIFNTDYFD